MSHRLFGRLSSKGQQRAITNLARCWPGLSPKRLARMAREARRERQRLNAAAERALKLEPRAFCRSLSLEGWELLPAPESAPSPALFLPSLGEPRLARRALELYRPDLQPMVEALPQDAATAQANASTSLALFALPLPRAHWLLKVEELSTGAEGLRRWLHHKVRCYPRLWPWDSIGPDEMSEAQVPHSEVAARVD